MHIVKLGQIRIMFSFLNFLCRTHSYQSYEPSKRFRKWAVSRKTLGFWGWL